MQNREHAAGSVGLIQRLRQKLGLTGALPLILGEEPPECRQLLADLDASLADMSLITRPNAGPDVLMPLRLELLGLDPGYVANVSPETHRALVGGCAKCHHWRRCARDLAAGNMQVGSKDTCINQRLLDELLRGRVKARSA